MNTIFFMCASICVVSLFSISSTAFEEKYKDQWTLLPDRAEHCQTEWDKVQKNTQGEGKYERSDFVGVRWLPKNKWIVQCQENLKPAPK